MARNRNNASQRAATLREAESALDGVEALEIVLENGERASFNLSEELAIPRDPRELFEAGRQSPAKLAFWNYQTERALHALRKAEAKLASAEGREYLIWRTFYEQEQGSVPTEATIRSHLSRDTKLHGFQVALRARKKEYGALRAVRDAMDHRDSMVRTLIGRYEPT
jgi:hypothetical protein